VRDRHLLQLAQVRELEREVVGGAAKEPFEKKKQGGGGGGIAGGADGHARGTGIDAPVTRSSGRRGDGVPRQA
jgi:hypothetical protein